MTLYLDVIWFLNFCIDYLLIALTALVLKRRFLHKRMVFAALFASMVVLLMFSPIASLFYTPWMKLLYSMMIVLIAFGYRRFSYFLQGLFMFYFVSFMTGGGLFALHFFWQTEVDILSGLMNANKGYFGSGISWVFVVLGFPLIWFFSKHRFDTIEMRKVQYDQLVEVDITIRGYTFRTIGLIDSGNQLTDPLSKKPVMIIEAKLLYPYFSKEAVDQVMSFQDGMGQSDYEDNQLMERVTIIPYKVIGQSSPFLTGIRPDRIKIYRNEKQVETTNVLLGLQDTELSADGMFKSIIHPKLVLGLETEKLA